MPCSSRSQKQRAQQPKALSEVVASRFSVSRGLAANVSMSIFGPAKYLQRAVSRRIVLQSSFLLSSAIQAFFLLLAQPFVWL